MKPFSESSPRLLLTRQPANSGSEYESLGELTETEVPVLDRSPGSCRELIRCEPSETGTFFARSHGQRKVRMASHERKRPAYEPVQSGRTIVTLIADPPRLARLRKIRSRHFKSDLDLQYVASWVLDIALLNLKATSAQFKAFVKYRKAEGFELDQSGLLLNSQLNSKAQFK